MNLEKQVVSLELSKQLKELGFKQDSIFEYRKFDGDKGFFWSSPLLVGKIPEKLGIANVGFGKLSTYTVAELGEKLPDRLDEKAQATDYETHYFFEITKDVKNWEVSYRGSGDSGCKIFVGDENLSNAMAKVLIYLKENNLIK